MGNTFAYIMLLGWPLIAVRLYQLKTIQEATLWTIIGGFMLLPVKTTVPFPVIWQLGKDTMLVFSAIVGCWLIKRQKIKFFTNIGLLQVLVIMLFVGRIMTVELNSGSLIVGGRFLKGLTSADLRSTIIVTFVQLAPFLIGRQFFRSYEDQLLMFRFLVIAGLIYSIPMFYEVRMTPQLHTMIYGYFPHSFLQQARDGGFRPVVFMGHGLLVAFFTVCVLISVVTLDKVGEKIRKRTLSLVGYYFVFVLILCKSKAALLYGLFAFVAVKKISYTNQFRMAIFLVILTLTYPILSITKIFPHQQVIELATEYMGAERAASLSFRFDNERILLAHGSEHFFFGWGGWGRNRVYDKETGRDISVTDGRWIITFGTSGFLGYIAEYGLLALCVFRAKSAVKRSKDEKELTLLAAHALLVALMMVDQLPNASLSSWLWLVAGILLGRSEDMRDKKMTIRSLDNI